MVLGRLLAGLIALAACGRVAFDEAPAFLDAAAADDAEPLACAPLPCAGSSSFMSCNGTCFAACMEASSRPAAELRCAEWGGTLATVHDAQANSCLQSLISGDVWIGYEQSATAVQVEEGWSWADGVTASHTNWRVGEP